MNANRLEAVSIALQRTESVLGLKPSQAVRSETGAVAMWRGGTEFECIDDHGRCLITDMPAAMGGEDRHVSPGWLFRAGLASCLATVIVMTAARRGITLTSLQVTTRSQSDIRGLLGMPDESGAPVAVGSRSIELSVRIAATDATDDELRELVDEADRHSPVSAVIRDGRSVSTRIEVSLT